VLAEANVPCTDLREMDAAHPEFSPANMHLRTGRAANPACSPSFASARDLLPCEERGPVAQNRRMSLALVAGTANPELGTAIAASLGTGLVPAELERFPDGEIRPSLGPVRGADVYLIQPTGPPANDNLVELLLLLDTCRRAGADRVTAIVPYFGYARQDRRSSAHQPIGARVAADAITSAGADRLVVVDPHTHSLEAMFGVPVEMLTAVPMLARAVSPAIADGSVVVAPDLGAMPLARHFASLLHAPLAVVSKHRIDAVTVSAQEVVGDVRDRPVAIVDDMISTGATIEAAVQALRANGAAGQTTVTATHGLLTGTAAARLRQCAIDRLVVTDTVAHHAAERCPGQTVTIESVACLLADAIGRLHASRPLGELLLPG
jgi:ribose-phosphate pyrophosphokinase